MPDQTIEIFDRPFAAAITPPGSKSLTNRALVLAALSDGACHLSNALFADDTLVMRESLAALGFEIRADEAGATVRVGGQRGSIPAAQAELFCGNSGTTIRFLAAMCSLGAGTYRLDGIERMRQRPIGPLVELLRNLGARCDYTMSEGFPPLEIRARTLRGGIARYGSRVSSQFLSAAVQVAPYAHNEVQIDLEPNQTSWTYVAMTMQLMDEFGITPELIRDPKTGQPTRVIVPQGKYRATTYAIEPDASNAAYFLAAAAISPGSKVTIEGLGRSSLQGDVGFADVLHRMGADLIFGKDFITIGGTDRLEGIDVDLSNMPDTAQTLAAVACFAKGPTMIRGLHTLRVKETDRISALSNELSKLGARVTVDGEAITIDPPKQIMPATIDTYDDHRMAMSFAVVGTRAGGIVIRDASCVTKTYPRFFDDLRSLSARS